nr:metallophosphoesterase [Campylobacter sp.]
MKIKRAFYSRCKWFFEQFQIYSVSKIRKFLSHGKKYDFTYVIGDVHGEFNTLIRLVSLIPNGSQVIFVGDLVNRGKKSSQVIRFIRENGFRSVLGNHDELIKELGEHIKQFGYKSAKQRYFSFLQRGGFRTLASYGICKKNGDELKNKEYLDEFYDDIEWIGSLPTYIELDIYKNNLPVVVSHAPIGDMWERRDDTQYIKEMALWNRQNPSKATEIFNVFGHTPQKDVFVSDTFANVDTGCCYGRKLSAYCVETGKVISVSRA